MAKTNVVELAGRGNTKKELFFRDREVQEEGPGADTYEMGFFEYTTLQLEKVEGLLKLHENDHETELGVLARATLACLECASQRIDRFDTQIRKHFGCVTLVSRTSDKQPGEIRFNQDKAAVSGSDFAGISFK
jgi:hypothetical protein